MGFLIFNFWTIATRNPSFRRDFGNWIFKAKKLLETLPQIQQVSTALLHCEHRTVRGTAGFDGENHGCSACFPSNDLLHLRSLRVASGQSDFQKAWNYFLSRPHWVWLNMFFFCCHYIISMWYCKILWDVMKVPGSRQSFPEVLWCRDTHQWCLYIYIFPIQIHTHVYIYIHIYIYIYYIPLKVGALALLIVSGADQSSKQRMGRSQEARGTSQRHLLLARHVAFGSWPVPLMFQCNV